MKPPEVEKSFELLWMKRARMVRVRQLQVREEITRIMPEEEEVLDHINWFYKM